MKNNTSAKLKEAIYWRTKPVIYKGDSRNVKNYVFPSARQAITGVLEAADLRRQDRVALPEWANFCVISAVSKIATPISLSETLKHNIRVEAALFFEQWGWPIPAIYRGEIVKRFKNLPIIIDRVDSADIDNANRTIFYPETRQFDIVSLTKILGLKGGGLALDNGKYMKFKEEPVYKKIAKNFNLGQNDIRLLEMFKSSVKLLHPDLKSWLAGNDLLRAIAKECFERRKNINLILGTSLVSNWENWMFRAMENGAGPGLAPLLRGAGDDKLSAAKRMLEEKYGLAAPIYHFNWSGNPLRPKYEKCLAMPVNSSVRNFGFILRSLKRYSR